MLVSAGLPVSANAINKDVGVHTKVSLNVRHRVVSPARIAERTASLEIRLKLLYLLFIYPCAPNLISLRSAGTMAA